MKPGYFVSCPREGKALLTESESEAKEYAKKIKQANYFKAWLTEQHGRKTWLLRNDNPSD